MTKILETTFTDLIARREKWEATELQASNAKLYKLLADCYILANKIAAERKLQRQLSDILKARDIKVQKNTPLVTKVVKVVFGAERRRASSYSLVLRAAEASGIQPLGLAAWLKSQNGVEEVRLSTSNPDRVSPKEARDRFIRTGEDRIDELAPIATLEREGSTPDQAGPVLLIANVMSDGTTQVLRFVTDERIVSMVLEQLGREGANDNTSDPGANASLRDSVIDEAMQSALEAPASDPEADEDAA